MKKSLSVLSVLAALGLFGLSQAQNKIILRAADIQPEAYPTVQGLKDMANRIKTASKGRIELQIFAGGQLGDERSTLEQTKLGVLDFVRVSSAPVTQFSPQIGVLSLPFLFRDAGHMWKVANGAVGKELLESLTNAGFIGLTYYDSGSRNFYTSKKAIKSVADMKGLKVRVQQSQIAIDMVEALGAKAVPLPIGELYSALQTGAVDGAENNYPSYGPLGFRHFEVAKFYALTGHSRVPELVLMSKQSWEKLSKDDQALIKKAAQESTVVQINLWNTYVAQSRAAILSGGAEVVSVKTKEFQEAMTPVYDKYKPTYGTLIERILSTK